MNRLQDRVDLIRQRRDVEELVREAGRQARRAGQRADQCPYQPRDGIGESERNALGRMRGFWLDGYNERRNRAA